MGLKKIEDFFFHGGAMIAIHLKIFQQDSLSIEEEKLVDVLKKCTGVFQIGYDLRLDYYGPFSFEMFSQDDFYKAKEMTLSEILLEIKRQIPELYFGDVGFAENTMNEELKRRIPEDILNHGKVFLFKWNYANDNEKAGPSLDIMGYDYFFSVIATTKSKICLITFWYD